MVIKTIIQIYLNIVTNLTISKIIWGFFLSILSVLENIFFFLNKPLIKHIVLLTFINIGKSFDILIYSDNK